MGPCFARQILGGCLLAIGWCALDRAQFFTTPSTQGVFFASRFFMKARCLSCSSVYQRVQRYDKSHALVGIVEIGADELIDFIEAIAQCIAMQEHGLRGSNSIAFANKVFEKRFAIARSMVSVV